MTTASVPETPEDVLATLTALSEAARTSQSAALAFYRRSFLIVAITALLFVSGLIWAGSLLSTINGRGVCNASTNHTIAADVHLLVAGNTNPSNYTIPPVCH